MVKSFYIGVAIIENNESDCAIVRIDSDNSVICTFNIMNQLLIAIVSTVRTLAQLPAHGSIKNYFNGLFLQ